MFSASFIFQPGEYDDEFHALNKAIDDVAQANEGFRGSEKWSSADGKKFNAIYYWEDMESLQSFARHPSHIEAKRKYRKWYDGYHIVISEIIRSYGDNNLSHITPNDRKKA